MSRYVHLSLKLDNLQDLQAGLEALGLPVESAPHRRVMLQGSLECAGEPVDLRLAAGVRGTVEDFGFVQTTTGDRTEIRLVCGELDQDLLRSELLPQLTQQIAELRVRQAAKRAGLSIEARSTDDRGTRRLTLRRSK